MRARLGDVVKVEASSKQVVGEKFWLLNLDMVEQQTGRVIAYNYVGREALNGSIIQFDTDCVLYSKLRPNLNKVVIPQENGFATSEMLPLRPDTKVLTKEYLAVFLRSDSFVAWAVSKTAGAKMPRLGTKELLGREIPLTSLSEQERIAQRFAGIDKLISLRKEQLTKLEELAKSRFIELIVNKGYPNVAIKTVLRQQNQTEKINDTKVEKFVTVGIRGTGARQRIIKDGKWPVPFTGYRVKGGQFIYSRIDARNGAFAILPDDLDNAVVSKDFPVFDIVTEKILPSVLLFSVLQDGFVRQIQNSSFGATNRQRIQEDVFGDYTITLPPIDVQNQFAAFVEQTDKSKLVIQQSLAELETLKKALMQKYFG